MYETPGEDGMIALRLVRLIERHSEELASELTHKLQTSSKTTDLRKVPLSELHHRTHEILMNLSEWLLARSGADIQRRYFELGAKRAAQGVSLSHYCWGIVLTKEHLWSFLQREGFLDGPVQLYGEIELLRLLDQFFDSALCYAADGFEHYAVNPDPTEQQAVRVVANRG
jgi:hypothetical protein